MTEETNGVKVQLAFESPEEKLERLLGKPLSPSQRATVYSRFLGYMLYDHLTTVDAKKILKVMDVATLQTETTISMMANGYLFHGALGSVGNGKSTLYHVLDLQNYTALCGKVGYVLVPC